MFSGMYTTSELCILATAYMRATGWSAWRLSCEAANHNRLFERLFEGYDCTAGICERVSDWFDSHWPDGTSWPESVERRRKVPQKTPLERVA